ncbi:cupin [Arthrobacter sp. Sa2BUA2]|uniref:Cupin n=1 Tax=Arthrobacter pullicola TaxID=2762224 RepID=A0ABR8YF12_9MICC|nr:cupin [Arthrobacter pullicola]MBD8042810.1 cupin [Arthrobacter pullicola]
MPSVETAAAKALEEATASEKGRSAAVLVHDGPLRQTILALRAGEVLAEHNSPPAASMYVLSGRVRVTGQDQSEIAAGEIVALTHVRHGVEALEDSVFLLTTVTSQAGESHGEAPATPQA